jgi:hypothetical protein
MQITNPNVALSLAPGGQAAAPFVLDHYGETFWYFFKSIASPSFSLFEGLGAGVTGQQILGAAASALRPNIGVGASIGGSIRIFCASLSRGLIETFLFGSYRPSSKFASASERQCFF